MRLKLIKLLLTMKLEYLPEPELEFGTGRHIDVRFGLMNYGPADQASSSAPTEIKLGLVGTQQTMEGLALWLEKCRGEVPAKNSKQPNLFPKFPGFNTETAFQSTLTLNTQFHQAVSSRKVVQICSQANKNTIVRDAVELFFEELEHLANNPSIGVLVCAPPMELVLAMEPSVGEVNSEDEEEFHVDFHDKLKALCMNLSKPLQIVLPMTYDNSKRKMQKAKSDRQRQLQDEATRAWNIHTALYYKAGGTPWRLPRQSSDLSSCYIGVAFYKSLDGSRIHTSVAQVFNERGDGIIVQGGAAKVSKEDRQIHLEKKDAESLLLKALKTYKFEHRTLPARIVLHKSTSFDENEVEGFWAAATNQGIEIVEMVSLTRSSTRLFRVGDYPPLRGTFLSLDDRNHVLYTKGAVDFFATYPGMYVPRPMLFRCDDVESTPTQLASEILALSKMNWNNTQFDGGSPITLRTADKVGEILRYVEEGHKIESRYSYYM